MDDVPNDVRPARLAQAEVGIGKARGREPRLELSGTELKRARRVILDSLRNRPQAVTSQEASATR
jgi:hypothetical protein